MQEIWKPIPNLNCQYIASNFGKIRTTIEFIDNPLNNHIRRQRNKHYKKDSLIGPKLSKKGYQRVNLNKKTYFVHRLIALTFLPNLHNYQQINHIDGNKINNNINNLEWVSNQQNRNHAVKNNLVMRRDKNCTFQKLTTAECISAVNKYKSGNTTLKQLGKEYNISKSGMQKIVKKYINY